MPFQHTLSQSPNTRRLPPARTVHGALDVHTKIASKKGIAVRPVIGDHASIRNKKGTREEAAAWICARYRQFVSIFERTEAIAV
jgi:hypothetical protein